MVGTDASILPGLLATRYLAIIGLTILFWDHCLTFQQERLLIWPSRVGFVKRALLFNRYLVPIVLAITVNLVVVSRILCENYPRVTFSISSRVNSCAVWFTMFSCIWIISMAILHGIILLRLLKLWDAKQIVIVASLVAFLVAETGSLVSVTLVANDLRLSSVFDPILSVCIMPHKPAALKIVWMFIVAFDTFTIVMMILNALSRPRGSHANLLKSLYRDGIHMFVILSVVGWINFTVAFTTPVSFSQIGIVCAFHDQLVL
ncbi:hypothetical protein K439DRAFT_1611835 [Ramaria rubella]|nr:hypothetical protein K439DRAFT_1611835 [Ramaria rubella]